MVNIVERIVNEEFQFGDDAELVAQALSQFVAEFAYVPVDVVQNFFGTLAGKDAQIASAHTEVGTDADCADRDQHAMEACRLFLENVTQFFLDEAGYFLLSGGIHSVGYEG